MPTTTAKICLTTLNSTYHHAAFGLRYLFANLQELQSQSQVIEWTIHRPPQEIAQKLADSSFQIIGFGVYIWNTRQTLEVVRALKKLRPQIIVVLGGPEVSYETESQEICQFADYVIKGEADILFYQLCRQILSTDSLPSQKIISGSLPEIKSLQLPYRYYSDKDIQDRIIYVEASRGCPYKCEYCLSSLDKSVRNFPLENFLAEMKILLDRGVRQFKFIDRTFNLSPTTSSQILQFFLEHIDKGLFLHFEMVPDRLPEELKKIISRFPAGSLQFEIGIQTWNPQVAALVSRRNDVTKVRENLRFLREETGVHTHADLIAGLPSEDLASFARGFDELAALEPDEIQVGILKRLKGTPIIRHDQEWQMNYNLEAPFQILSTKTISAEEIRKVQYFSKHWDLIANSGNFKSTISQIKSGLQSQKASLFDWFWNLSTFLSQRHEKAHSLHLIDLFESLLIYLIEKEKWPQSEATFFLAQDYARGGRQDLPRFLRGELSLTQSPSSARPVTAAPKRQQAHLRH